MTALDAGVLAALDEAVETANAEVAAAYPGNPTGRQPVSTLYVPADRFGAGTVAELGARASALMDTHAPDSAAMASAFGLDRAFALAGEVRERVARKLREEPVEDLRVDFEDGYGVRDDAEEDADAAAAAGTIATGHADGTLPPFLGLRVKSFSDGLHRRSVRTLERFLGVLLARTGGELPAGFVLTLPKILSPAHVAAFAEVLGALEAASGLPHGRLRFELQVETTQSIIAADGTIALPQLVMAAAGRCTAAHFGTYDYTAACGLPAGEQRIDHPSCDAARHVMQIALAGRGIRLSDGSTNVLPAGEGHEDLHVAWRLHASHVRRSLAHGFFQGWDLAAAQLPSRYVAVYAFHLAALHDTTARIRAWRDATPAPGGVLDEPATVTALLSSLRRALDCGAVSPAEVVDRTGAAPAELWPADPPVP